MAEECELELAEKDVFTGASLDTDCDAPLYEEITKKELQYQADSDSPEPQYLNCPLSPARSFYPHSLEYPAENSNRPEPCPSEGAGGYSAVLAKTATTYILELVVKLGVAVARGQFYILLLAWLLYC